MAGDYDCGIVIVTKYWLQEEILYQLSQLLLSSARTLHLGNMAVECIDELIEDKKELILTRKLI